MGLEQIHVGRARVALRPRKGADLVLFRSHTRHDLGRPVAGQAGRRRCRCVGKSSKSEAAWPASAPASRPSLRRRVDHGRGIQVIVDQGREVGGVGDRRRANRRGGRRRAGRQPGREAQHPPPPLSHPDHPPEPQQQVPCARNRRRKPAPAASSNVNAVGTLANENQRGQRGFATRSEPGARGTKGRAAPDVPRTYCPRRSSVRTDLATAFRVSRKTPAPLVAQALLLGSGCICLLGKYGPT